MMEVTSDVLPRTSNRAVEDSSYLSVCEVEIRRLCLCGMQSWDIQHQSVNIQANTGYVVKSIFTVQRGLIPCCIFKEKNTKTIESRISEGPNWGKTLSLSFI